MGGGGAVVEGGGGGTEQALMCKVATLVKFHCKIVYYLESRHTYTI